MQTDLKISNSQQKKAFFNVFSKKMTSSESTPLYGKKKH